MMNREEHEEIKRLIETGCLSEDLEPIKCSACKDNSMNDQTLAEEGSYISEVERRCANCHKILGHWAHGNWRILDN